MHIHTDIYTYMMHTLIYTSTHDVHIHTDGVYKYSLHVMLHVHVQYEFMTYCWDYEIFQ